MWRNSGPLAIGGGDPVPPGAHRAGLGRRAVGNGSFPPLALRIGLRAHDADQEPFLGLLDILHPDGGQFRPPESAGEADQQQSAIANPDQPGGKGIDDGSQIVGEQRAACRFWAVPWTRRMPLSVSPTLRFSVSAGADDRPRGALC